MSKVFILNDLRLERGILDANCECFEVLMVYGVQCAGRILPSTKHCTRLCTLLYRECQPSLTRMDYASGVLLT